MKQTGLNLKTGVKDVYTENYKTLLRDIKEDLNKSSDISYPWIGRLDIVNMSVLSKLTYRFNAFPGSFL